MITKMCKRKRIIELKDRHTKDDDKAGGKYEEIAQMGEDHMDTSLCCVRK